MANNLTITQKEARKIALDSQGLFRKHNSLLDIINQLSYIQIDTISVTERAHNHVFFSRDQTFKPEEITQLMDDKSIFEYWSHAAAYLPISDFRYSLYKKKEYTTGSKHWFPRDKKVERYVLDRITEEGSLQSKDFDNLKNKNHEWYEWKPAKIALTNLFMDGSLMIANRKGFHKIFDLTERVLPAKIDTTTPTLNEYCIHLIMNTIKSHGIASIQEISYLRKGVKPTVTKLIHQLIEAGDLIEIKVENNSLTYYASTIHQEITIGKELHILSPFDNLVIQRKRIESLFNFNYQIECYVPEKKRKFGYYVLPILFGDEFVARMDAKADRKSNIFYIKGFWFEENYTPTTQFYKQLAKKIKTYSLFCGCKIIKLEHVSPSIYKTQLNEAISNVR